MTDPDDEIIAALRRSPGDPPPTDVYARVASGVRRRRRKRALGTAGVAACLVAVIAIVPAVVRNGRTTDRPPSRPVQSAPPGPVQSASSAPTCGTTLDAQPAGGPTPAGDGLVPGTPSSAVLCEYDQIHQPQALKRHAVLTGAMLGKVLLTLGDLQLTNEVAKCPLQPTVDLLTFGYSDGSTATLRIGCAMVWRSDSAHAMLNDLVSSLVEAILDAASSSPPPSSAAPVIIHGGGVVLELDDAQHFRIVNLDTGRSTPVALTGTPLGPSMIASNPAGGWVVTYTPDAVSQPDSASVRLALVDPSGSAAPFGPIYQTSISGLAVSPDGSRVAVALMTPTASVVTLPMPGHAGGTRTWIADDINVNEMIDLSWAPDGNRLTYIAGSQTGAGIGGEPVTLDTSKATKAPTRSSWPQQNCDGVGSAWLGTSGKFAVFDGCVPTALFRTVDPSTGATIGPTVQLPNPGCLEAWVHPSSDGSRSLIAWCSGVYLVADGNVVSLGPHVLDAAWGG